MIWPLPFMSAAQAEEALLAQVLDSTTSSAADATLVRALGEEADALRCVAMHAASRMIKGAGMHRVSDLFAAFERMLDEPPSEPKRAERTVGAVLSLMGELGEALDASQLSRMVSRCVPLLRHESDIIAGGAARGIANTMCGALRSERASLGGEIKTLLDAGISEVANAKTLDASRGGAHGVGACIGAAGASGIGRFNVMASLVAIIDNTPRGATCSRESAVLAIEQLSLQLGSGFEPFGIPMLRPLVALYADKDKRVADAAAGAVRAMLGQLSPLAVKLVLPALYDGMEATAWRTKVECLKALSVLAEHAPSSVGPRLPDAIPRVMECLANTNAKVQDSASVALPLLCACVDNPETQKLRPLLIKAFIKPETTLECIDELLCTTFVNAMDGTSLAFIMPLLLRGLNDSKYETTRKVSRPCFNFCLSAHRPFVSGRPLLW